MDGRLPQHDNRKISQRIWDNQTEEIIGTIKIYTKTITMEQDNTQQEFKTITQTSPDTILCDGVVWYSRLGYGRLLGLSTQSLGSPYAHVRSGRAAHMTFMGLSFFRVI